MGKKQPRCTSASSSITIWVFIYAEPHSYRRRGPFRAIAGWQCLWVKCFLIDLFSLPRLAFIFGSIYTENGKWHSENEMNCLGCNLRIFIYLFYYISHKWYNWIVVLHVPFVVYFQQLMRPETIKDMAFSVSPVLSLSLPLSSKRN